MARSLKPLEPGLNAVVRMYDRLVGGATTFDSHRQSVDDELNTRPRKRLNRDTLAERLESLLELQ